MLKLNSMLLTIDIQKTFDSVNHQFLILALKKYELEKCALNGWSSTKETGVMRHARMIYNKVFTLVKGTRQGNPISAYLFILVLESV